MDKLTMMKRVRRTGRTLIALALAASLPVAADAQDKKRALPPKAASTAPAAHKAASDPLEAMLERKALRGAYNPVLLSFLAEEGRGALAANQHKEALDQLVAGFREHADIKPGEQAVAGIATALGELLGGTVGQGISEGAAQVWTEWVDAAFVLHKAGYKAESAAFFENCLKVFPYDSLRARCAAGLAEGEPEKVFSILMGFLGNEYPDEVHNMALRLLGELAGIEGFPQEKKDAVIEVLVKHTHGLGSVGNRQAAIDGLARSRDARAVEPLRRLTKGFLKSEEDERAALRALVLTFKDAAALEAVRKKIKKGDEERFFATAVLIEAGEDAGFEAALKELTKKKKGLFGAVMSTGDEKDYKPDLVFALVEKGGDRAKTVLAQAIPAHKPDEWITAYMAIGLLELGDPSSIDLVRKALGKDDWAFTRLRAAEALARSGDTSGIPVLKVMTQSKGGLKGAIRDQILGKRQVDPEGLRAAIADSLARIDHADAVPILAGLLDDRSDSVRLSAAYALARLKDPAALDGIAKALGVDYGKQDGRSRNPEVHAQLIRAAAARFPVDPRTRKLLADGSQSAYASVQFLSLVATKATRAS